VSATRVATGRMFAALHERNFRLYFIGQLISQSGTWMQSVAQGWLVLQITNSSFDLGVVVALQFLPMLLLGSFGGLYADRNDKRRILYATQISAGLLALALGLLVSTHHATIEAVYVLALLLGVVNLFDNPARQAFVQEMVGRELIPNAVSLNSVLMNGGRLIGPALAAGLIAGVGIATCFYVNAGSYVAVLVALFLMRASELRPIDTVHRAKGQLRLGLRYAYGTPVIRDVIAVVAVVGTFAYNFTVTLPELTRTTFHQSSATAYGILVAAMGLGAVVGGLYVAWRSRPTVHFLAVIGTSFGVAATVVALSPTLLVAQVAAIPMGACSIMFIATANATLQMNSAEAMRGRVMSLYAIAFLGTTPIGAPLVGAIVSATNPRVGIAVGSLLTMATCVWLWVTFRRRLGDVVTS